MGCVSAWWRHIRSFGVFCVASLNKLLKKSLSCWWSETLWRSCDVFIMDGMPQSCVKQSICGAIINQIITKLQIITANENRHIPAKYNVSQSNIPDHNSFWPRVVLTSILLGQTSNQRRPKSATASGEIYKSHELYQELIYAWIYISSSFYSYMLGGRSYSVAWAVGRFKSYG